MKNVLITILQWILPTVYTIYHTDSEMAAKSYHKDLGIVFSNDLSWKHHYKNRMPKSYRPFDLLCFTLSIHHSPEIRKKLCISPWPSQN